MIRTVALFRLVTDWPPARMNVHTYVPLSSTRAGLTKSVEPFAGPALSVPTAGPAQRYEPPCSVSP